MGIRLGIILILLATLTLATPARCDTRLQGLVTDSEGAVISGARLLIHWDPSGSTVGLTTNVGIKQDLVTTTNSNGSFSIDLPSGFYDVFVSAPAFSPRCDKIRIIQTSGEIYNARLDASPIVSSELAH